jgi:hypothetical protein
MQRERSLAPTDTVTANWSASPATAVVFLFAIESLKLEGAIDSAVDGIHTKASSWN